MSRAGGLREGRWAHVLLALAALAYGLLAGLRPPNLWAATHLLFDYDFGFARRSLAGGVLSLFGDGVSYRALALVSMGVLALWVALLFACVARAARFTTGAWLLLAGYLVSGGFVFLAHSVGYLDHAGMVLGLACLLLPGGVAGMALRMLLCLVMILVHEALFLLVFPVVVFDGVLRVLGAEPGQRRGPGLALALMVGIVTGATALVGSAALDPGLEPAVSAHLEAKAVDFAPRPDSMQVLFNQGGDNLGVMAASWQNPLTVKRFLHALVLILPYMAVIAVLIVWATGRIWPGRGMRWGVSVLGIGCAMAPLSLVVLAWDFYRFASQAQTMGTLVVLALFAAGARAGLQSGFSASLAMVLVAGVFVNATANPKLFDGHEVRRPPFGEVAAGAAAVLTGRAPLFPVPER